MLVDIAKLSGNNKDAQSRCGVNDIGLFSIASYLVIALFSLQ